MSERPTTSFSSRPKVGGRDHSGRERASEWRAWDVMAEASAPAENESAAPVHKKIAWLRQLTHSVDDSDDSDSSGVSVPGQSTTGGGDSNGPGTLAAEAHVAKAKSAKAVRSTPTKKHKKKKKKKEKAGDTSSSESDSESDRKSRASERNTKRKRTPTPTYKLQEGEAMRIAASRKREVSAKERNDSFKSASSKALKQRPSSSGSSRKRPLPTPTQDETVGSDRANCVQETQDRALAVALTAEDGRRTRRRTLSDEAVESVSSTTQFIGDSLTDLMKRKKKTAKKLGPEPRTATSEKALRPVKKRRLSTDSATTTPRAGAERTTLGKTSTSPVRVLKLHDGRLHTVRVSEVKRKSPRDTVGTTRQPTAATGGGGESVRRRKPAVESEQQPLKRLESVREAVSGVVKATSDIGTTEPPTVSSTDNAQPLVDQVLHQSSDTVSTHDVTDASSQDATGDVGSAPADAVAEKEDGEEEDGEVEASKAVPAPPLATTTNDKNTAASVAPPDLLSFVIPKKKVVRTETLGPLSRVAAVGSALPPSGNTSLRRTPASSPPSRETDANNSTNQPLGAERAPVRRRRRTKNPVPVAATTLSREEVAFMRLARKVNSFYAASEKLHAQTTLSASPASVGRYDVVDANGTVVPDLLPRMKCPTKKALKAETERYPAPYFGVAMTLPSDTVATEPDATNTATNALSETGDAAVPSVEPLVFARTDDRDVYQRKMYGTTFVPQLLRGRTTLIMRHVRYVRKSSGFQFNTDRDRDDFATELSERFTMHQSVPRTDIPPKNWQQLLKQQPAVVYLHYMNSEDAELAAQQFVDDHGAPLERKRTNRVGGTITSTPSSPAVSVLPVAPRRSRSSERGASGQLPEASPVFPKSSSEFTRDRNNDDTGRNDNGGVSRDPRPEPDAVSLGHDSSSQPMYQDERRGYDRPPEGRHSGGRHSGAADVGRGPREWPPPRSHDWSGRSHMGDARDRRSDRFSDTRGGGRFSTQRYGPGPTIAPRSHGDEPLDRDSRATRRSRSPSQTRQLSAEAPLSQVPEEDEAFDPTYWPTGKSDDDERLDGEVASDKLESQTATASEEPTDRSSTHPSSSDQEQPDEPVRHSQDSQRSSRSPDRTQLATRSGSGDRVDEGRDEKTTSEPKLQPSQKEEVGESAASLDGDTEAGELGEVLEDDSRHEYRRDVGGDQRPHRVSDYVSRHRHDNDNDEYFRHDSHGSGFEKRALDDRERHFRDQAFGNRDAFARRRSRSRSQSRSQPREDRDRRGFFDSGRRERDFGRGRDNGYFDNGRGGNGGGRGGRGGYDAGNSFDPHYHHPHHPHHPHHQLQPPPPPRFHHPPAPHDRERHFPRDGDGYRPRPRPY